MTRTEDAAPLETTCWTGGFPVRWVLCTCARMHIFQDAGMGCVEPSLDLNAIGVARTPETFDYDTNRGHGPTRDYVLDWGTPGALRVPGCTFARIQVWVA